MAATNSVFTVQLHQVRLFGYHGLYEEEKVLGNEFEVNIKIQLNPYQPAQLSIDDTVDYSKVYTILKEVFARPEELLETLCYKIAEAIKLAFQQLTFISVQVIKLQMPVIGFIGSASATFDQSFE